jgi:EAL domain-containing protein (putative c-di-GMP-specific phosphodiesterase class I)
MYEAKRAGRQQYRFYDHEMNGRARSRLMLEESVRTAIENRDFNLVYQPQVAIADGQIRGFEALLRWQHPSVGDVPPGLFLPLLEEARLISRLGSWIYHRGAKQRKAWETLFAEDLVLGVSLSSTQFGLPNLVTELRQVLERHGLKPQQLEVEVTEEALMSNPDETRKQLRLLRNLGVRVALDDFGSGACSLAHLRDLELDTLKLDRHLIARLPGSERDAALARSVIDLCNRLGLLVIAEGVETVAQYEWLQANGCQYVQGFLVARPLMAEDTGHFVEPFDWGALTS